MSCCCNFWALISSNLDNSILPNSINKRSTKTIVRPNFSVVSDSYERVEKAPEFSTKLFLMMEVGYVPSLTLLICSHCSQYSPPFSVNRFSTTRFLKETKTNKKTPNPHPKCSQRNIFSIRTHRSFSSAQDSSTSVKDPQERLTLWPDSTTDTDAPNKWGLCIKARSSIWDFKNSTGGMALKPNKHTVKKLSRLRTSELQHSYPSQTPEGIS